MDRILDVFDFYKNIEWYIQTNDSKYLYDAYNLFVYTRIAQYISDIDIDFMMYNMVSNERKYPYGFIRRRYINEKCLFKFYAKNFVKTPESFEKYIDTLASMFNDIPRRDLALNVLFYTNETNNGELCKCKSRKVYYTSTCERVEVCKCLNRLVSKML